MELRYTMEPNINLQLQAPILNLYPHPPKSQMNGEKDPLLIEGDSSLFNKTQYLLTNSMATQTIIK
jgi:hypothetical protein